MKQSELVTISERDVAKEETSVNAQLLTRAGYIDRLMAGVYSFLPLGVRVLTKIEQIVREEMCALGSQEVLMPALQPRENWEKTGRWETLDILFRLKGAGDRDLCLGPTHEEVVTPLVGRFVKSYRSLPKSVFQIQTKFRNEARAKSGLLRGREFRMKDMYSFHASDADLQSYYERSKTAYHNVFRRVGLGEKTLITYASGGSFSKYSHEFQTLTPYGEDAVFICSKCNIAVNKEILSDLSSHCPQCDSAELREEKAIEVGNIFMLSTRFSDAFGLAYKDDKSIDQRIYMGCYGIGPSRLMGAIVELLHDERGITWPNSVAPFRVHLLSLFKNQAEMNPAEDLYNKLKENNIEVLFDDRLGASPGEKFADSDLLGMPMRIVLSPRSLEKGGVEMKLRRSDKGEVISIEAAIEAAKNLAK